jgi:hypothetical protein
MHPKVKALYDDHPEIDRPISAIEDSEKEFNNRTKNFDKVITIDQLWRTRRGGGLKAVEYIWYLKRTTSKDFKGNKKAFVKPEGKYDMPVLAFEWEDNEGQGKATGVQTYEQMFDIPFTKETVEEYLKSGMITADTGFAIDGGSRQYGGFTYDMFVERDFDELVYFGQNGKFPSAEEKAIISGPPSKRMGLTPKQ